MSKRRPSGDGMVRKKDDGRWEGRIVIGHKENGDSIFRYIYAPTQKELTAKLRQEIIAYQGVDLTEDSKLTLNEWMDYWLDAIMAGTIRPSTLNGYRRYADLYIKPYLGDKQISKITPTDVQKMYEVLKARGRVKEHAQYGHQLSGSMVHSIHTMFHEAMKAAKESHIIAKNPTENIPVPKANPKPKQILNDDQLEQFMEAIKHDAVWHDFFYTELTTGLRRGELCGLMWADFDEAAGTLAVRRTIHTEKGGRLVAGATKTGRRDPKYPAAGQVLPSFCRNEKAFLVRVDLPESAEARIPYQSPLRIRPPEGLAGLRWPAQHSVPRLAAYLRHPCPGLRRGRQDVVRHSGPYKGILHAGYLHPCHWRYAAHRRRNRRRFYDRNPGRGDETLAKRRKRGDGSVHLRKDGRWEGRVVIGYDDNGYPKTKNVLAKNKKECLQKLKVLKDSLKKVELERLSSDMCFGAWLDHWYQNQCKPTIGAKTQTDYENRIYRHIIPEIGQIPLNRLTAADLQQFYRQLKQGGRLQAVEQYGSGLSDRMVKCCHVTCRAALDQAVKQGPHPEKSRRCL